MVNIRSLNKAHLSGKVHQLPVIYKDYFGDRFFRFTVEVNRENKKAIIPVMGHEIFLPSNLKVGTFVEVEGILKSMQKGKLFELAIAPIDLGAIKIAKKSETTPMCSVSLEGTVCTPPFIRHREKQTDFLLKSNGNTFPCLAFGMKANSTKNMLRVGSEVSIMATLDGSEAIVIESFKKIW